jgi:hypothetical protein
LGRHTLARMFVSHPSINYIFKVQECVLSHMHADKKINVLQQFPWCLSERIMTDALTRSQEGIHCCSSSCTHCPHSCFERKLNCKWLVKWIWTIIYQDRHKWCMDIHNSIGLTNSITCMRKLWTRNSFL